MKGLKSQVSYPSPQQMAAYLLRNTYVENECAGNQDYCTPRDKNSFFPKTIRLWNTLTATVAEAHGLVPFKQELSSLMI